MNKVLLFQLPLRDACLELQDLEHLIYLFLSRTDPGACDQVIFSV